MNGTYLTPREFEVLAHVARGYATKMISDELGISKKTVDRHRTNLCEKLNARSTALMVLRAIEFGVVSVPVRPLVPTRNGKVLRYMVPA